jgi:hypothetical protein
MKNKIFLFYIIFIFFISIVQAQEAAQEAEQENNDLWGSGGYYLESYRKKSMDAEGINRWFNTQYVYLGLNYRFLNSMEATADIMHYLTPAPGFNDPLISIQKLYISTTVSDWLCLTFGKQRLKWGTAKVYNSIDKLQAVVNPYDTRQMLEGVPGINAEYFISEWLGFSVFAIPREELRRTGFAGRFDLVLLDTDIGLGVIKYNFDHIKAITQSGLETETKDRYAWFFDIKRYFGSVGVYSELEYRTTREKEYAFFNGVEYNLNNKNTARNNVYRVTAGMDFPFKISGRSDMTLSMEYFYNSEGFSENEALEFYKNYKTHIPAVSFNSPVIKTPMLLPSDFSRYGTFRKHYYFLSFSGIQIIFNKMWFSLSSLGNLETLSCSFQPEFLFKIDNLVFINLNYNYYHCFKNEDKYPSELNFFDRNQSLALSVNISF